VSEEPLEPGFELRQTGQQLGLERLDGKQRNQTHDGANLEADHVAVGQVQRVIEELVVGVPQADAVAVAADVAHGLGDLQEVLEELGSDVLVDGVVQGQLQGDTQQVQTV